MKPSVLSALVLTVAIPGAAGCAVPQGAPRMASALSTTNAETRSSAEKVDVVLVVPNPGRSLARMQRLVRGSAAASAVLAAATRHVQAFDLEQPIQSVRRGETDVASFGVSRETAAKIRVSQSAEGPCGVTPDGPRPRMFCVSKGAELTREARALGQLAPGTAHSDAHVEASRAWFASHAAGAAALPAASGLLRDVAGMTLDLSLDGTAEARLALHLDGKDPMASAMLAAPVAPPPPSFFKLPADAELALYAHAPAAADVAGLRQKLIDDVAQLFAGTASAPTEVAAVRAHLEPLLFTGGSFAIATGFDRKAAAAAVARAEHDERKLTDVSAAHKPWAVIGFEEPAARWIDNVSWLMSHDRSSPEGVTITKPGARLGLPADAVEIKSRAKGGGVVFVVPDGKARTWIGIGDDEPTAASHVRVASRGAPDATLASRPGLASLKGSATFGGFVTAAGAAWVAGHDEDDKLMTATLAARSLETAARTPIPFKGSVVHGDAGGGTVSLRVDLAPAAIADLFAMFGPGSSED